MCVHDIGEIFEKRALGLKEIHILCYVCVYFNFVQLTAFEKFGLFDLVLKYNRHCAQYGLVLNLYS